MYVLGPVTVCRRGPAQQSGTGYFDGGGLRRHNPRRGFRPESVLHWQGFCPLADITSYRWPDFLLL